MWDYHQDLEAVKNWEEKIEQVANLILHCYINLALSGLSKLGLTKAYKQFYHLYSITHM